MSEREQFKIVSFKIVSCGDSWLYEKATGMLKCNRRIIIQMSNGREHILTEEHKGWHVLGESMNESCADALIVIFTQLYKSRSLPFRHSSTCDGKQIWFRDDGASYCNCSYQSMTEETKAKYRRVP